jgi:hypothetical protein
MSPARFYTVNVAVAIVSVKAKPGTGKGLAHGPHPAALYLGVCPLTVTYNPPNIYSRRTRLWWGTALICGANFIGIVEQFVSDIDTRSPIIYRINRWKGRSGEVQVHIRTQRLL